MAHLTTVHHPLDPRIFHKEVKSLHNAGFEVHLVAPHNQSESIDGIPVIALERSKRRYRRLLMQVPAYQAARSMDADLYHFHDPELIPVAYLLKRTTGARIIYDMHEDYWWHGSIEGRLIRALEHWCFSWVDHVVLAEQGYVPIMEPYNAPFTIVENYFRPFEEKPVNAKKVREPIRLLYAGVVGKGRGLYSMLELATHLDRRRVDSELRIVGACYRDGERRESLRRLSSNGVAAKWIGSGGYVAPSGMVPHYRWANVGLALYEGNPNHVHSYPTKFYEYLHYGLPILCSDFPLWRQFVEKHECGAVVPPGDVEAAARVLQRWANRPEEYRALSEAAREASTQYRWEVMGQRLVDLYDDLLAR